MGSRGSWGVLGGNGKPRDETERQAVPRGSFRQSKPALDVAEKDSVRDRVASGEAQQTSVHRAQGEHGSFPRGSPRKAGEGVIWRKRCRSETGTLEVTGVSEASRAPGANEAALILMPSLGFQWPHPLTQGLSQRPRSPRDRMSPALRYTVAPVLSPGVKSLLTPPPLLSVRPQGPTRPSVLCWGGWGGCL